MKKPQTYYYQDEINQEFSGIKRERKSIDQSFKYIRKSFLYRLCAFFVYQLIMRPFSYLYSYFISHVRVVNKKILKPYRKKGYFLYGNHTNIPQDAYTPNILNGYKHNYVIVNSENVSKKGTENLMLMLGALPLPSSLKAMRNFLYAVEKRLLQGGAITIYPEAHVWPYYTSIRPFEDTAFKYPYRFSYPSFAFTTTYQKRKHSILPKITIYVDGPFFSPLGYSEKEAQAYLCQRVYKVMKERSLFSTYSYNTYIKGEKQI